MGGALLETEARTILNQGISQGIGQGISQGKNEAQKEMVVNLLKIGKLTVEEIARCSGLSIDEVRKLAELQTV